MCIGPGVCHITGTYVTGNINRVMRHVLKIWLWHRNSPLLNLVKLFEYASLEVRLRLSNTLKSALYLSLLNL